MMPSPRPQEQFLHPRRVPLRSLLRMQSPGSRLSTFIDGIQMSPRQSPACKPTHSTLRRLALWCLMHWSGSRMRSTPPSRFGGVAERVFVEAVPWTSMGLTRLRVCVSNTINERKMLHNGPINDACIYLAMTLYNGDNGGSLTGFDDRSNSFGYEAGD